MPVFLLLNAAFLSAYTTYRLDVLRSDLAAETASLGFRLGKGIARPLARSDIATVKSVLATLAGNHSIHCAIVRSNDQPVAETVAGDAPSALKEAHDRHDVEFLREEYPEAIAQAKVGIDQIATIVGAVKHFSQADQGQHEPTDLIDVVKNALELSKSNRSAVADVIFDNDQQLSPIQCNGTLFSIGLQTAMKAAA